MGVFIEGNKVAIITQPIPFLKTIPFGLPKNVDNSLRHEINFIIKHNEFLAEDTIKAKLALLYYYCISIIVEI